MSSGYLDKQHRKLARKVEDAKGRRRVANLALLSVSGVLTGCVALVLGSSFIAAWGFPYLPAAMAWTGIILGAATLLIIAIGTFFFLEDGGLDGEGPWQQVREAERELNDYLDEKL